MRGRKYPRKRRSSWDSGTYNDHLHIRLLITDTSVIFAASEPNPLAFNNVLAHSTLMTTNYRMTCPVFSPFQGRIFICLGEG